VLLVIIMVIIFCLPFGPSGVPWRDEFDWKFVNYAPLTVGVVIIAVGLWWVLSARHTFTGPVRTVKMDDTGRVLDEDAPAQGV
jgi:undecaprenyl pyrophosphate phosphatase UppP